MDASTPSTLLQTLVYSSAATTAVREPPSANQMTRWWRANRRVAERLCVHETAKKALDSDATREGRHAGGLLRLEAITGDKSDVCCETSKDQQASP
jgi:hypothetical protein